MVPHPGHAKKKKHMETCTLQQWWGSFCLPALMGGGGWYDVCGSNNSLFTCGENLRQLVSQNRILHESLLMVSHGKDRSMFF